jgi:hypothetical protein
MTAEAATCLDSKLIRLRVATQSSCVGFEPGFTRVTNQDLIRDIEIFMEHLRILQSTFQGIKRQLIRQSLRPHQANPNPPAVAQAIERYLLMLDDDIRKLDKDAIQIFTLMGWKC